MDENQFRAICQNALEGLASKKLNLEMLIERRAQAQERRVVPPFTTIVGHLQKGLTFRSASSIGVVVRRGANGA